VRDLPKTGEGHRVGLRLQRHRPCHREGEESGGRRGDQDRSRSDRKRGAGAIPVAQPQHEPCAQERQDARDHEKGIGSGIDAGHHADTQRSGTEDCRSPPGSAEERRFQPSQEDQVGERGDPAGGRRLGHQQCGCCGHAHQTRDAGPPPPGEPPHRCREEQKTQRVDRISDGLTAQRLVGKAEREGAEEEIAVSGMVAQVDGAVPRGTQRLGEQRRADRVAARHRPDEERGQPVHKRGEVGERSKAERDRLHGQRHPPQAPTLHGQGRFGRGHPGTPLEAVPAPDVAGPSRRAATSSLSQTTSEPDW